MTKLIKRTAFKIVAATVLVSLFFLALMYPVISARHDDKIHFLMSPNPTAIFNPPVGKKADVMIVWAAVVKDSTFGSFLMAMFGYETFATESSKDLMEFHWYTENLKGGMAYAYMGSKQLGADVEYVYEVTLARINVIMSENQLNATVFVKNRILFKAGFWADTSIPVESRIEPTGMQPEVSLSVEAFQGLLRASVTGLETGDLIGGRFEYIDVELYDSSLLP